MSHYMNKLIFLLFFLNISCNPVKKFWNPSNLSPLVSTNPVFDLNKVDSSIKIIILNFFAPNCPPCITEAPELEKLVQTIKIKYPHVLFIPITSVLSSIGENKNSIDSFSTKHKYEIQKFIQKYRIPKPVYLATTSQLKDYQVTGFPETYILYRQKSKNTSFSFYLKRKFISNITQSDLMPYIQFYQNDSRPNNKNY